NNRYICVIALGPGVPSRITFDPAGDWTALWAPDGSRIVFASAGRGPNTHIYQKSSNGVGADELVLDSDRSEIPVNWSHDGGYIVFSRPRMGSGPPAYDTWLLPTSGEKKPKPFLESPFDKLHARVSPDNHW